MELGQNVKVTIDNDESNTDKFLAQYLETDEEGNIWVVSPLANEHDRKAILSIVEREQSQGIFEDYIPPELDEMIIAYYRQEDGSFETVLGYPVEVSEEKVDPQFQNIVIGEEIWFLQRIDSTHFYMSNSPDHKGMAMHIGQLTGRSFHEDLRDWLRGVILISGNEYSDIR